MKPAQCLGTRLAKREFSAAAVVLILLFPAVGFAELATPPPPPGSSQPDTAALLQQARAAYNALEYEQVLPLVSAVLAHEEDDIEARLDAALMQGSSLAIIGDTIGAEKPFRLLLRGRPEYELPPQTAPKILAVFRKVQVEEKAIAEQMRELRRQRLISTLSLEHSLPLAHEGGLPLWLSFAISNPKKAVSKMRVQYRRQGDPKYASLPLQPSQNGLWEGEIPAIWTASSTNYVIEICASSWSGDGLELATVGNPATPYRIKVTAGDAREEIPVVESPLFWSAIGLTLAVSGLAGGVSYYLVNQPPASDLGPVDLRE